MLIAALNGRQRQDVERGDWQACRANALVFLIFLGATGFSYVFRVLGGDDLMTSTLVNLVDTAWEMLAFVMVLIFLLGFPFEWIEICLIVLPIFGPILLKYDFSEHLGDQRYMMAWFGTLVAVNLQTAFMTPPFGATLFYMKGTAPPGVTMSDVYRGMYPFVALQLVGAALHLFSGIVLWLPHLAGSTSAARSGASPSRSACRRETRWRRWPHPWFRPDRDQLTARVL